MDTCTNWAEIGKAIQRARDLLWGHKSLYTEIGDYLLLLDLLERILRALESSSSTANSDISLVSSVDLCISKFGDVMQTLVKKRSTSFGFLKVRDGCKQLNGYHAELKKLVQLLAIARSAEANLEVKELGSKLVSDLDSYFDISFGLLYDSLTDGDKTTTFHQKCDDEDSTICIGFLKDGSILGGFASKSWGSGDGWKRAPGSFLFSLRDKEGRQSFVKATLFQNIQHAMFGGGTSTFPIFGCGIDLHFGCDSFISTRASANLTDRSSSYKVTEGDPSNSYFEGIGFQNFKVSCLQVFAVGKSFSLVSLCKAFLLNEKCMDAECKEKKFRT